MSNRTDAFGGEANGGRVVMATTFDCDVELAADHGEPSLDHILKWMNCCPSKAVAYDVWARGNYVRRLIYNRIRNKTPILIPFSYVDEIRWAYRRLALTGLPLEFVYVGPPLEKMKVLTLHPWGNIDSGWGYVSARGSRCKIKGQDWFPIVGAAKPLPEPFLDWITDEAPEAFVRGDVFISAGELIGLSDANFDDSIAQMTDLNRGVAVHNKAVTTEDTIANIELPFLDELGPHEFNKFMKENREDLIVFQSTLKSLVNGAADIDEVLKKLEVEIAQLAKIHKSLRKKTTILKIGGALSVSAAALAAAAVSGAGMTPSSTLTIAMTGGAAGTAVTKVLCDLWNQDADRDKEIGKSAYSLLWKLGLESSAQVKKSSAAASFKPLRHRLTPAADSMDFDCHWLCPPNGMKHLGVRRIT